MDSTDIKEIEDAAARLFVELDFQQVPFRGVPAYGWEDEYRRLTYVESFKGFVLEWAGSFGKALNELFEDSDIYPLQWGREGILSALRADLVQVQEEALWARRACGFVNQIHHVTLAVFQADILPELHKPGVFLAEMDGRRIQTLRKYINTASELFRFPIPSPSVDGYLDWMTDLEWLGANAYAFAILISITQVHISIQKAR